MNTHNMVRLTAALLLGGMLTATPLAARADGDGLNLQLSSGFLAPRVPALVFGSSSETSVTQLETTVFGLPRNIGDGERVFRGVAAATLIGLAVYGLASNNFSDTANAVLMGVSVLPAATAASGYCPLYHALGVDTTFLDF